MRLRPSLEEAPRPGPGVHSDPLPGRAGPVGSLFGIWSATRWQYTGRESPARQVDVVCDLGGSVTLSLSDGTCVLTWDVGHGSRGLAGTVAVAGDCLTITPHGAAKAESLWFRLSGDTLALSADESAWDLDGDGLEEAAEFVAVLVRL